MQKLIILITERSSQIIRSTDPGTSAIVHVRVPKRKPFSAVALGPIDLWWRGKGNGRRPVYRRETGDLVGNGGVGVSLGPRMCNSIDVYLPVPLSGKFVLRFKYSTKFHSRTGRHIKTVCLYRERPGAKEYEGRSRRKEQQFSQRKCRDNGKSLSLSACSLPRLENVAAQKNCHNLWLSYEATISQPTDWETNRPIYMLALYMLPLSIHTYGIVSYHIWRVVEREPANSVCVFIIHGFN